MGIRRLDRNLPALPGARLDAHFAERQRQQAGCHLFARSDHRIIFGLIIDRVVGDRFGRLAAPAHQFVGLAGHGRDDNGHLIAGLHLTLHMLGDVADAFNIGDGRAAEFHYQTGHDCLH